MKFAILGSSAEENWVGMSKTELEAISNDCFAFIGGELDTPAKAFDAHLMHGMNFAYDSFLNQRYRQLALRG